MQIFNTISHSTNEHMKTLALVSLIFLPITFLAGVYGTNFTDFPGMCVLFSVFFYLRGKVIFISLSDFHPFFFFLVV